MYTSAQFASALQGVYILLHHMADYRIIGLTSRRQTEG